MAEKDTCDIYCYDQAKVNRVRGRLEEEANGLTHAVRLFKALADENRVKIVSALCGEQELCVCDVANIIGSSVATASHHLRMLRGQNVVTYRRSGKMAFYSLSDGGMARLLETAMLCGNRGKANV